jgi:hypothetical protein
MRALTAALLVASLCLPRSSAEAQALDSPYAEEMRHHFYEQLAKSPWRALGFELLLPGAGNWYTGLYGPAAATLAASMVGASLWIAGALRDRSGVAHAGIATFACARGYGVVSAPIGALLLNAAYRRELGLDARF